MSAIKSVLGVYSRNHIQTDTETIFALPWSREWKQLSGQFGFFQLEEREIWGCGPTWVIKNFVLIDDEKMLTSILGNNQDTILKEDLDQGVELCEE